MISVKMVIQDEEMEVIKKVSLNMPESAKKRKKAAVLYIVCAIIYLGLGVLSLMHHDRIAFLLFGFAIIFLLFACTRKAVQSHIYGKSMRKMMEKQDVHEREYIFDEEGVEIRSKLGSGKNNWSAFYEWGTEGHYIYLMRVDNQYVLVDKNKLSDEECGELLTLIEKQMGKK